VREKKSEKARSRGVRTDLREREGTKAAGGTLFGENVPVAGAAVRMCVLNLSTTRIADRAGEQEKAGRSPLSHDRDAFVA
jgi:hypothetical protein